MRRYSGALPRSSAYPEAVIDIDAIRARFEALEPVLDERRAVIVRGR
jgi:hypothetical protein